MARKAQKQPAMSPWVKSRERASTERGEKREAVLDAAARAFSERGYHNTSLDDIAERLGVSKPTLYYYSRNKSDLLEAIVARALDRVLAVDASDSGRSGMEQLREFLRHYAEVVTDYNCRCLLQISQVDLPEDLMNRVRGAMRVTDGRIRSIIERGIKDKSIAPCDVHITAFIMGGALNWNLRWYSPTSVVPAAETLIDQLVAGITPKATAKPKPRATGKTSD